MTTEVAYEVTYWAFRGIGTDYCQNFEAYQPDTNTIWRQEDGVQVPPGDDLKYVVKVTQLSEDWEEALDENGVETLYDGLPFEVEFAEDTPLAKKANWPEVQKMRVRQSEAFAVASGFIAACGAFTEAAWISTGS